ncbi:MAG: alginate O-acetyltransferase complex protein AlgI [Polaribacter sp.]|jgi:alginate O-acetyltransferase complex protein AlgI
MIFNSLEFLLFFPLVAAIYFGMAPRWRWLLLLIASYCFYSYWNNWYLLIILFSTLVDYTTGVQIEKTKNKKGKRMILYASIFLNLGMLFFFKYFNFFFDQIAQLADFFGTSFTGVEHSLALPLGISFFTFQTMSYSIDVYKGRIKAERHIGKYALYVSFFAQLAAGPIERAKSLLPQFHGKFKFDYKRVVEGLQLILWGFFKKLVIADRLSQYVQEVYQNPESYQGATIWLATAFFIIQIFCDFSAYSDMAIGTARILGIKLSLNFGHSPYFETSFTQFWEKWHITLTRWVRDYLYMPLARIFRKPWQRPWLWLVVFLLIGLWHGANWTFMVWGGLNGLYLVFENWWQQKNILNNQGLSDSWLKKGASSVLVFSLTAFSAVFFVADSIPTAFTLLERSMTFSTQNIFLFGEWNFGINGLLILFLEWMHYKMKDQQIYEFLVGWNTFQRWPFYILTLNAILFLSYFSKVDFIYFDF